MKKIKILIPIYNDWQSLNKLLSDIDKHLKESQHDISLIVINDASSEKNSDKIPTLTPAIMVRRVKIWKKIAKNEKTILYFFILKINMSTLFKRYTVHTKSTNFKLFKLSNNGINS